MTSVRKYQRMIGDFADDTFRIATPCSIMMHMEKEFKELQEHINPNTQRLTDSQAMELVDIFILGFHLARRAGFDLEELLDEKFLILQERQWGLPDEDGVVEHLREVRS